MRRSNERKRPRGVRPKIPSYDINGRPLVGYGPGHEFDGNGMKTAATCHYDLWSLQFPTLNSDVG